MKQHDPSPATPDAAKELDQKIAGLREQIVGEQASVSARQARLQSDYRRNLGGPGGPEYANRQLLQDQNDVALALQKISVSQKLLDDLKEQRQRAHPTEAIRLRSNETFLRLRAWNEVQEASERLVHQILYAEGYKHIDPAHPRGGPDGNGDAICYRDGRRLLVGVYFPREILPFSTLKRKFRDDIRGVAQNDAEGFVFVTNQNVTRSKQKQLKDIGAPTDVEIFHLERITSILDRPDMAGVRCQYLDIPVGFQGA